MSDWSATVLIIALVAIIFGTIGFLIYEDAQVAKACVTSGGEWNGHECTHDN